MRTRQKRGRSKTPRIGVGTVPVSKLEALKKERFPPEGKAYRVAKGLAALQQKCGIQLKPEEWKIIAEDPDLEDQW